jgi:hypothetical protein
LNDTTKFFKAHHEYHGLGERKEGEEKKIITAKPSQIRPLVNPGTNKYINK